MLGQVEFDKGTLCHLDLHIPDEMMLSVKSIRRIDEMIDHYKRRLRSENYFIYKITEPRTMCTESGPIMAVRFHLIKLRDVKVELSESTKLILKRFSQHAL